MANANEAAVCELVGIERATVSIVEEQKATQAQVESVSLRF
jgi:hypothetical protein